jgi:hypothetical protein
MFSREDENIIDSLMCSLLLDSPPSTPLGQVPGRITVLIKFL